MIRNCLFYIFLFLSTAVVAQTGGRHSFEFLNDPGNARLSALGGVNVSRVNDLNLFQSNPALLADSMAQQASVGYHILPADLGLMNLSYGIDLGRAGVLALGIHHMEYGSFQGYDATGAETGEIAAGETAIFIGRGHTIGHFRLGANIKTVFSNIAGYRSTAIMADLGGLFSHPNGRFTVGLVMKNMGLMLSDYSGTSQSSLPFDVQAGVTVKPEHMPVRFSATVRNLTQPGVTYHDPASNTEAPRLVNKILRHFNFGAEVLFHRNFNVLIGYNFLAHQDLKLETTGGGAGFAIGIMARVKAFEFIVSRSGYVVGNAGYAFTLSSDFKKILKRKHG